jgi:pseudaminic acid synthase
MTPDFAIAGRKIGPGYPAYMVAEMSANHGQDFDEAVRIVHAMKEAGADAVKLQTYTPDTLTIDCERKDFQIGKGTLWEGWNLYRLYGEAYTPWEWQPKLKVLAESLGMHCFSTPFDDTAVEFLEGMGVPAHKIASFEMIDHGLLCRVARTGKPVMMSTGMASREEIDESVAVLRENGCRDLALLKCTSAYPAPFAEMNLRTIADLASRYNVPAGLSDHTLGIVVPVTAVAAGACIIEKHFTLTRSKPGPDSAFSLEPHEFRAMVDAVRVAEAALGRVSYEVTEREQASRVFRRSLYAVADIPAGTLFTGQNIRSIRPGYGLPPKYLPHLLGRRSAIAIERGTPLSWDLVAGGAAGLPAGTPDPMRSR